MDNATTRNMPRWQSELTRQLPIKNNILLTGNIRDHHFHDLSIVNKIYPFSEILIDVLRGCGYEQIFLWNALLGFKPGKTSIRPSDAYSSELDKYIGDCSIEKILHVLECFFLERNKKEAIILDYVTILNIDNLKRLYSISSVLSHEANKNNIKTNNIFRPTLIWLVDDIKTMSSFLYNDNQNFATIRVDTPDSESRATAAKNFLLASKIAKYDNYSVKACNMLAEKTEGMSLNDIKNITIIADKENIPIESISDAINLYKFGTTENPWEKINREKIKNGFTFLKSRVKGQDHAIMHLLDIIKRAAIAIGRKGEEHRPRGVLFLAGPTGVGKTELVKALANLLFGDDNAYSRFDMSEFNVGHTVARLIGSPAGYVDSEKGGQLVNAVRDKPFSVLLFDEIEKAHPRILDIFLQILDDGVLTSGLGDKADFSNAIICFTSNMGQYHIDKNGVANQVVFASDSYNEIEEKLKKEIKNYFNTKIVRPELLNRIGESILVFDFIRMDAGIQILEAMLDTFLSHARGQGFLLDISCSAKDSLAELCLSDLSHGGRGIRNQWEAYFLTPLSRALFDNDAKPGQAWSIEDISLNKVTIIQKDYEITEICSLSHDANEISHLPSNALLQPSQIIYKNWYNSILRANVTEKLFGTKHALNDLYISISGCPLCKNGEDGDRKDLEAQLVEWLEEKKSLPIQSICLVTGPVGSGKSSFLKMFAARHCAHRNIILIPMEASDPSLSLEAIVQQYANVTGFQENPYDLEDDLILLLDGIDESIDQYASTDCAMQACIPEFAKAIHQRHQCAKRLHIVITGKEIDFQNQSGSLLDEVAVYRILPFSAEQREEWWTNYIKRTEGDVNRSIAFLNNSNSSTVAMQILANPLLNHLSAIAYKTIDVKLLEERGACGVFIDFFNKIYEENYKNKKIRIALQSRHVPDDILERLFETAAILSWKNKGNHAMRSEMLTNHLFAVSDDNIKLPSNIYDKIKLSAIFHSAKDERNVEIGKSTKIYKFAHHIFRDFLVARSLIRLVEYNPSVENFVRLCGDSIINAEIYDFIKDDIQKNGANLLSSEAHGARYPLLSWASGLGHMLSRVLKDGLNFGDTLEQDQQAILMNTEEAILVLLSAVSNCTGFRTDLNHSYGSTALHDCLSRLLGSRELRITRKVLNHLDMSGVDLSGMNLSKCNLFSANLNSIYGCRGANFDGADLREALLHGSSFYNCSFIGTDFRGAHASATIEDSNLTDALFDGAGKGEIKFKNSKLDGTIYYKKT